MPPVGVVPISHKILIESNYLPFQVYLKESVTMMAMETKFSNNLELNFFCQSIVLLEIFSRINLAFSAKFYLMVMLQSDQFY